MKFFVPVIFLFLIVSSCKKKAQPEMSSLNENCDCANEVSAKFLMEELATPIEFSGFRKQTDTDTIYAGRNVRFYGLEANADYTWYIGSELLNEREALIQERDSLAEERNKLLSMVHQMENSISWKLAGPIRRVSNAFLKKKVG